MSTMELELTQDEMIDEYIEVAFSNGFSKGTANVSPSDMKRLAPLLRYYAKKPHPFTACVRDNRKRFGPRTNAICAVVKDLIMHSTKWRNQGKSKAHLSEDELHEYVIHEPLPDEFVEWVLSMDEEEMEHWAALSQGDPADPAYGNSQEKLEGGKASDVNEHGDGMWTNAPPQEADYHYAEDPNKASCGICKWFEDGICAHWASRADSHYVSNAFQYDPAKGEAVGLSTDEEQKGILAEMFFAGSGREEKAEGDGLLWKPILREGTWKLSPGPGQMPVDKPITVVADGASDASKMKISMSELMENFQVGAVEHVQIPTKHGASVLENTGFAKDLRLVKDENGKAVLEAGLHFTEPDVRAKAERGSIANTSAGVLFNFRRKDTGEQYGAVLDHVALTNRPWLDGLKPFGAQMGADDKVEVLGFSEDPEPVAPGDHERLEGGEHVSTKEDEKNEVVAFSYEDALGLSEDEVKERLREYVVLKKNEKQTAIDERCRAWEADKKAPAVIAEARRIMLADEGAIAVNLSEDTGQVSLTATEVVERLVKASPTVNLADEQVTDEDASEGKKPKEDAKDENKEAKLSHAEKVLATELHLSGEFSEEEAVVEAKKRLATEKS